MTIGPGSRIAERYVLGHVVGAGGMGVVYRATTDRTDGELVIKVPHTTLLDDHEVRRRFRDEIVAGTRIDHPHVVHVLEGGCSTGIPYIVMELVAGTSLAHLARARDSFPPPAALAMVLQLLDGLAAIHAAGVVHGDVKTDNALVITQRDGTPKLKLIDFGLARVAGRAPRVTATPALAGTPGYLAPELLDGGLPTYASDQYAAGIILYELLTGELPSLHDTALPSEIAIPCPCKGLVEVIRRTLAVDPAARFPDVQALAACLRAHIPAAHRSPPPLLSTDGPTGKWPAVRP